MIFQLKDTFLFIDNQWNYFFLSALRSKVGEECWCVEKKKAGIQLKCPKIIGQNWTGVKK